MYFFGSVSDLVGVWDSFWGFGNVFGVNGYGNLLRYRGDIFLNYERVK